MYQNNEPAVLYLPKIFKRVLGLPWVADVEVIAEPGDIAEFEVADEYELTRDVETVVVDVVVVVIEVVVVGFIRSTKILMHHWLVRRSLKEIFF